jgi:Cu+-exporting ATPase
VTLMAQEGIEPGSSTELATPKNSARGASVISACDGQLLGLAVSDPIKASTPEALASLRAAGLRVVMATGDGLTTARAVGQRLVSMRSTERSNRPTNLRSWKFQREGHVVAMAGDGINDAPALAKAMSASPWEPGPMWLNSAQLTLVKSDLRGIARARALSVATVRNMRQNLAFAFLYNALGTRLPPAPSIRRMDWFSRR